MESHWPAPKANELEAQSYDIAEDSPLVKQQSEASQTTDARNEANFWPRRYSEQPRETSRNTNKPTRPASSSVLTNERWRLCFCQNVA